MENDTFEILIKELRELYSMSGVLEREFLEDTLNYVIKDFLEQTDDYME